MSASTATEKGTGSLPWYLWVLIVPTALAIIAGITVSMLPEDPDLLYEEARAALTGGEKEKFNTLVARLESHEEQTPRVAFLKALLAANESRDPLALKLFEEAAKDPNLEAEALSRIGSSYAKMAQYKKAITSFEASLRKEPENVQTQLMVAQLYYSMGGIIHSIQLLDDILMNDPSREDARELRARQYLDLMDYENAFRDYASLLETPGQKAAASPDTIDGYLKCLLQVGDSERIEEANLEFGPDISDPILKWEVQVAAGQFDGVRKAIQEASLQRDNGPPLHRLEARVALAEGDVQRASKAAKEAIALFPRDPRVFEMAVDVFSKSGEAEWLASAEKNLEALREWRQKANDAMGRIGSDYETGEVRKTVGDALLQLGRVSESLAWYRVAEVVEPGYKGPSVDEVFDSVRDLQPLVALPESPETDKPETDKPETDKPETDKPETDKPETDKSETDKPETDKPETDKPETDKPETDKPATDKPETDKPETDKPETDKPETDKPETDGEQNAEGASDNTPLAEEKAADSEEA